MESFWEFAKTLLIVGAVLFGLILILLAIPGSRLRKVFSTIFFALAGLFGLYVINPLDFIPDIIPLLGQVDDVLASVLAVVSAIGGLLFYISGRKSLPGEEKNNRTDLYLK
jgi:uncharacterized membrane protein YkvA (DUF1232 family)